MFKNSWTLHCEGHAAASIRKPASLSCFYLNVKSWKERVTNRHILLNSTDIKTRLTWQETMKWLWIAKESGFRKVHKKPYEPFWNLTICGKCKPLVHSSDRKAKSITLASKYSSKRDFGMTLISFNFNKDPAKLRLCLNQFRRT